jgi:hypothetical protein
LLVEFYQRYLGLASPNVHGGPSSTSSQDLDLILVQIQQECKLLALTRREKGQ